MKHADATYPAMEPCEYLAVHVKQVRRKPKANTGAQRHDVDDCQRASPALCFRPRMGSKPEANNVCCEHDSQDERFPVVGMSSQRRHFGKWTKASRLQAPVLFDRKGRRKITWRLVHAQSHTSRAN
ncbi:hypothetical protein N7537_010424 [Penicillium hordei]|uniref:Uncharacterized protein n=1 Tax=Penicillium hordei TaxID=40994 RepID=A0AAD6GY28_9EURO|nr:uncharacterized protein N7537_010424 [Penicillium hordei]KAJ5593520.1 hypothetical protein N7537_010424 [Penicillium hordei]